MPPPAPSTNLVWRRRNDIAKHPFYVWRACSQEEDVMSGTADKASGLANEAIGKVKQAIGGVVSSDELKAKGLAQELKGHAQQIEGDAKDAISETAKGVSSAVRESRIRERAYELWEEEGYPDGRDRAHWEQASSEIEAHGSLR
jgi:uncharacterized protein YjbJ (UPF0337 family)